MAQSNNPTQPPRGPQHNRSRDGGSPNDRGPRPDRGPRDAGRDNGNRNAPRQAAPAPRETREDRDRREGHELEYLLIRPGGCLNAIMGRGYLPLRWNQHRDVSLFRPGLYLRHAGGLHQVGRDLSFDDAVLYATWDDPDATYRLGPDHTAKPGLHAAFLVRSPFSEGPPWLPMTAGVQATQAEVESGILSPWLDQVASIRFRAVLQPGRDAMGVASTRAEEEEAGSGAVRESLLYLAKFPEDPSPAAAAVRRMLVDNGHGLHRVGIGLMHADDAERRHLLDRVLGELAPDVAPLVRAVWHLWQSDPADATAWEQRTRELLTILSPLLKPDAGFRGASQYGTFITWLVGLFGPRPDRAGQWPALSLFAACRFLRKTQRRPELIDHPDAELLRFPFSRAQFSAALRDLAYFPAEESDLERVIRALASAEVSSQLARPRLEHLRAFRVVSNRFRGYPVAGRTWMARYEQVLTAWSYRGAELREGRVDPRNLEANLVLDFPTPGVLRAMGRVLGAHTPASRALAQVLAHAEHPLAVALAKHGPADGDESAADAALVQRLDQATGARRVTRDGIAQTIALTELVVARAQAQKPLTGAPLREPTLAADAGVRAHFLYWRTFCRSLILGETARYDAFLSGLAPTFASLPRKYQVEVAALVRQLAKRTAEEWTGRATWARLMSESVDAALADGSLGDLRADRFQDLLAALSDVDASALAARVDRLAALPWMDAVELSRLLETIRRSGARLEIVRSPVFKSIHARLAGVAGLTGARARVEWVRCAIEGDRQVQTVRWLLDTDGDGRFCADPRFTTWFAGPGAAAGDFPTNAIIELLELAVKVVGDEHVDIVLAHISQATQWPATERLKLLLEANRPGPALEWMQRTSTGDEEQARGCLDQVISGARSGRQLRAASLALRDLEGRLGRDLPDLRASLQQAFARYRPARQLLDGFAMALDGWRCAGLPSQGDALAHLAGKAGPWAVETGHRALLGFIAWIVDTHTAQALREPLHAVLAEGAPASRLGAAVDGLELPSEVRSAVEVWAALPPRDNPSRVVRGALADGAWHRATDRAVIRAVTEAFGAAVEPAALHPTLVSALQNAAASLATGVAAEQVVAAAADAAEAAEVAGASEAPGTALTEAETPVGEALGADSSGEQSDAAPPDAEASAVSEVGAAESTAQAAEPSATESGQPLRAPRERKKKERQPQPERMAPEAKLVQSLRSHARARLMAALQDGAQLCAEIEPGLVWASLPQLRRLRDFSPAFFDGRREVLSALATVATSARMRLADNRHLTTSDFLDGEWSELDRTDLAVLASFLVAIQQRHELQPRFELRRGGVALALLPAAAPAAAEKPRRRRGETKGKAAELAVAVGPETVVEPEGVDASSALESAVLDAPETDEHLVGAGAEVTVPDGGEGGELPEAVAPVVVEASESLAADRPETSDVAAEDVNRRLAGKALVKALRSGFEPGASRSARLLAVGDELIPWVAARMLERNRALRLRFDLEEGQPLAILTWRDRR